MAEILPNILGIIANWGRWSEMVAVKLLNIMSGATTFENILSMRVLEWLVVLVVHEIKGLNEWEAWKSKIHFSDYSHDNWRG